MKCLWKSLALLPFVCVPNTFGQPGRTVEIEDTDVTEIRTGMGYSTLLQFDSRPTSAVLGDQDAFRVEYVGNGLTIKPLAPKLTTNLFVFTDYDRFSFRLVVTKGTNVDYQVRVKRRSRLPTSGIAQRRPEPGLAPTQPLRTEKEGTMAQNGPLSLGIETVSLPPSQAAILVNFSVHISAKELSQDDPRLAKPRIGLLQGGKPVPIHDLYLSAPTLVGGELRSDGILVFRTGLLQGFSHLELQLGHPSKETVVVTVPISIEKLYRKEAARGTSRKGR